MTTPRSTSIKRTTAETSIELELTLDADGSSSIATGLGFLDHMLATLALHWRVDLSLTCTGDLHVDDHHTIEDCALTLGRAIDQCLGDRRAIARFGFAFAPLDESLARAVVDLSGRAHASIDLGLRGERLGDIATENLSHFFVSLASSARCAIHLDVLRGSNDHHRAEAAFKACALALRQAVAIDPASPGVPSTKGVL